MYYQVEQVLKKYEPETENFYKGRGILICETDQGLFALKEYLGSEEKAEFLYWLGIYLENQGIRCDGMIKNREDLLLTEGIDGVNYTMHHWVKGKECDVKSRMDIMMTVSHLARFHKCCQGVELPDAKPLSEGAPGKHLNLQDTYRRHDRELKKIKGYIEKRRKKSDFERLYLSCFATFYSQSRQVLHSLQEKEAGQGAYTVGICHGEFNQHNIVLHAQGPVIIHMEHAYVGIQMTDLGNFMRKILEKYEWEERLGMDMLREYCRISPLKPADLTGLYYRLSYPEKFWKIANHYYNSSKVWDSGRNREKLQKEIRQNVARSRFLEKFEKLL